MAIKVIRPDLAADPNFRARFRREVAAAGRVRGRFVAEVLAADVETSRPWMAGRVELAGDCAPIERSDSVAAGPQPAIIAFRWRGCKWGTRHVSADTCEPWIASTLR